MSNDINATFDTRRAAELAVEHLVQEHKVSRTDIVVSADGAANSSGTERSGADAPNTESGSDLQPKLAGAIRVTVRSEGAPHEVIRSALREAGATLAQ